MLKFFAVLTLFIVQFANANEYLVEDLMEDNAKTVVFEDIKDKTANKMMNNIKKNLNLTLNIKISSDIKNIFNKIIDIDKIDEKRLKSVFLEKYDLSESDIVISGYVVDGIVKGDNALIVILFDVKQNELFESRYIFNKNNWKDISDIISDDILKIFIGENTTYFNTKILYIGENNGKRSVFLTDFNIYNDTQITDDKDLVVTPIFSKINANEIYYIKLTEDGSFLFRYDIYNDIEEKIEIGDSVFSPNFNPSLNEIAYSKSVDGITNIYKYNFDTKENLKITKGNAIDTSPNYSPDGKNIVFTSDRSGVKKLYIANVDGSNIRGITKNNSGSYDNPSWSPSGDLIAFIKQKEKRFHIGLITVDDANEKILINSYLIEGLRWSPDGRYLMYSKQENFDDKIAIYTFDLTTGVEYKVPLPSNENIIDPDWMIKYNY
ncbi:MAG: hypothetical protein LBC92_03525 [Rickettsiales bacterium]|jgi:TolB protein|nr:hypothetical protein [Rickettsiales bacterium]